MKYTGFMENEELIKKVDMERIAKEGDKIYQSLKADYLPEEKGKYLAIEIDSKKVYLAPTSLAAVESTKKQHPNKVFYIVKIGFDVVEMLASWPLYPARV